MVNPIPRIEEKRMPPCNWYPEDLVQAKSKRRPGIMECKRLPKVFLL